MGCLLMPPGPRCETDEVTTRVERPVQEAVAARQATQRDEEQWRDEKEKLLARHDTLTREIDQIEAQTDELTRAAAAARQRIADKEKELADIEAIQGQIQPFIQEMIAWLRQSLDEGPPMLPAERRERVERLVRLADDPETTTSEKFRKLMEAFMVEAEYGHTIDVYQEHIPLEDKSVLVNIFRLGRLNLFYQTLDRASCGVFDVAAGHWQALPDKYNPAIHTALEIGAKRQPVELLSLPLGRIKTP
jgi:small-conductance mechanosensitive channel